MELFTTAFLTLFLVIDPIGLTPMFIALTQGLSAQMRRGVAIRATLIAAMVLALFALFGEELLGFMGIGFPAFRIAGGLLLFLTAVEMLFNKRSQRREETTEVEDFHDPSVFPLATPLTAGPGAMAAMILLTGDGGGSWENASIVIAAMAAVVFICFTLFLLSGVLERLLGQTGINVITRLLGMLLAALAVQFVVDGLRGLGALP